MLQDMPFAYEIRNIIRVMIFILFSFTWYYSSWWIHKNISPFFQGYFTGTGRIYDDVTKWKHFPRYWPFVREFTGHRWIPLRKASDAELWCFLWSAPDKLLGKQSWGWWFETVSSSLWRHCNVVCVQSMKGLHKTNCKYGNSSKVLHQTLKAHPCHKYKAASISISKMISPWRIYASMACRLRRDP